MGGFKRRLIEDEESRKRPTCLADLQASKVGVFCWCNRCGHNSKADTDQLAAQLGPDFPVPEIGSRMRCSACGSKDVATRPAWPSLGQIARHV